LYETFGPDHLPNRPRWGQSRVIVSRWRREGGCPAGEKGGDLDSRFSRVRGAPTLGDVSNQTFLSTGT
jgi:hypothetical protein